MSARFPLGLVVATPDALDLLQRHGKTPAEYLSRHQSGEWGNLSAHDRTENELSVREGFRILSSYKLSPFSTLWIITEADRSSTCLLLPEEY